MAITDFNKIKKLEVADASDQPTISRTMCLKITSGDDSITGTGEIVLDWSNISSKADIGVYDENDNLLDYYFESFDETDKKAVIWVYRDWVQDGSTQLQISYGDGPEDQSVEASTVFSKESNLEAAYLFNESSGDLKDVSGNNNDGTVNGATQGETGIVGGAYSFDGDDDYVQADPVSGDYKHIRKWILCNNGITNGDYESLLNFRNSNPQAYICIGDNTGFADSETLTVGDGDTSSDYGRTYIKDTFDDDWHCIDIVWNGSHYDIFVDDEQCDVYSGDEGHAGLLTSSNNYDYTRIGNNRDDRYLSGLFSSLSFYDASLLSDDRTALYSATKSSPDFFSQQAGEITKTIATKSASDVSTDSAQLNGTLYSLEDNSSLDVYFEWGEDTSYGNTTSTQTLSETGDFNDAISGLTEDVTYHFRAVATDGTDTWEGDDKSFIAAEIESVGSFFAVAF